MYIAGGLVAFMFASKLPLKQIAKYGGLAAAALGIADVLGIYKISQFLGMIPQVPIPISASMHQIVYPMDINIRIIQSVIKFLS